MVQRTFLWCLWDTRGMYRVELYAQVRRSVFVEELHLALVWRRLGSLSRTFPSLWNQSRFSAVWEVESGRGRPP